jgi:hypothetical protein
MIIEKMGLSYKNQKKTQPKEKRIGKVKLLAISYRLRAGS